MSCSAVTGGWSSFPDADVADMHIDGYICLRGTVLIYAFDQELHSTVHAWMRRYGEREGGFLLGKGHARPSWHCKHRQSPLVRVNFVPKGFGVTKTMHTAVTWTSISDDTRESVYATKVT
jgi:hypothetical protein